MSSLWVMPSYKRSRYPKVNERRRKREFNSRSTGQLGRYRRERQEDLREAWTPERRGKRARHGLVNTGYMASLMADRASILAEARGEIPVGPSFDGRNRAYVRGAPERAGAAPTPQESQAVQMESSSLVSPTESGEWLAHLPDGSTKTFRYRSEAEGAARSLV